MTELLPDGNAIDNNGNVVAIYDIDPESNVYTPETKERPVKQAVLYLGEVATNEVVVPNMQQELQYLQQHEWQHEAAVWDNLGLGVFSSQEYKTLPSSDYDKLQRVLRNYSVTLQDRFKRIRNAEGIVSYDLKLEDQYGRDRTPEELLRYANGLEQLHSQLLQSNAINDEHVLTKRQLRNAPHCKYVSVERVEEGKLVLIDRTPYATQRSA